MFVFLYFSPEKRLFNLIKNNLSFFTNYGFYTFLYGSSSRRIHGKHSENEEVDDYDDVVDNSRLIHNYISTHLQSEKENPFTQNQTDGQADRQTGYTERLDVGGGVVGSDEPTKV